MRHVLVVLFVVGAFAISGEATAAVTVGSSLRERADLYARCDSFCTETQVSRPGGLAGATIPADGVLIRWRVRSATRGWVRLRILRPQPDGSYLPVAASDPQQLTYTHAPGQDSLYTFAAKIDVLAGDVLALDHDRAASALFHSYGADASYATATFAPALGELAGVPAEPVTGRELLLNADLQPDGVDPTPTPPTSTPPTPGYEGPTVAGEGGPTKPTGKDPRGHGGGKPTRAEPSATTQTSKGHSGGKPKRSEPQTSTTQTSKGHNGGKPERNDPPASTKQSSSGHAGGTPQRQEPTTSAKEESKPHSGGKPQREEPTRPKGRKKKRHGGGTPKRDDPPAVPKAPGFTPH
jgi:hypothetical protein